MSYLLTLQPLEERKKIIARSLVQLESKLVPYIYSKRQFEVILKKLDGTRLTRTEERYWYGQIKKKLDALAIINELAIGLFLHNEQPQILLTAKKEYYINNGNVILKERIEKAKEIIDEFEKKGRDKIMVYGSFLTKKKYNDIDVFIVAADKDEEEMVENIHVYYIPGSELDKSLLFQTIKQIAVANFDINVEYKNKITPEALLDLYSEIINLISNKFDFKCELRNLVAGTSLLIKNKFIDAIELENEVELILKKPVVNLNKFLADFFKKYVAKKEIRQMIEKNNYIIKNYKSCEDYKEVNKFLWVFVR